MTEGTSRDSLSIYIDSDDANNNNNNSDYNSNRRNLRRPEMINKLTS
ncbi:MAG: hypothetical protein M3270_00315 [Thermoproteota archaeon]|nr:hypothetical protein [Thermoproteota archaeon]